MSKVFGYAVFNNKHKRISSKIYSKIGFAKRWITDNRYYTYSNIDDYDIIELVPGKVTPAMSFITPEKLLEIMKK